MSIRAKLIESGLFCDPQTMSWPGDGARQAIAVTTAKFPVEAALGEVLRALGKLAKELTEHADSSGRGSKLAQGCDLVVEALSNGVDIGEDIELPAWVWLTVDAFGEPVRLDVLGADEAAPENLNTTRLGVRR